jgi:HAD superfamily hydrolase (TIGR01490 family)
MATTTDSTAVTSGAAAQSARGAAFFDVDRTLIAGASALRLARPLRRHGLLSRRVQLATLVQQLGFSARGADDEALDKFAMSIRSIIRGWSQDKVREVVAEELERRVHPTVFREALDRIELHHKQGQKVYAVSATMEDIIEPFAELLDLDGSVATQMEIVDGKYTGEILNGCHGPQKAVRLSAFAEAENIDLAASSAYSDSISDEAFLRAVGRPYAVNPDAKLRKLAEDEGWGILFFRTRVKAPLHKHRAARASLFAVVAGLGIGAARRRKRRNRA